MLSCVCCAFPARTGEFDGCYRKPRIFFTSLRKPRSLIRFCDKLRALRSDVKNCVVLDSTRRVYDKHTLSILHNFAREHRMKLLFRSGTVITSPQCHGSPASRSQNTTFNHLTFPIPGKILNKAVTSQKTFIHVRLLRGNAALETFIEILS